MLQGIARVIADGDEESEEGAAEGGEGTEGGESAGTTSEADAPTD